MAELSVMGLVEVLPRAPRLLRRIGETVAVIRELRPHAVVTIDAPGFCFRGAMRLKRATRSGAPIPPIVHDEHQFRAGGTGLQFICCVPHH